MRKALLLVVPLLVPLLVGVVVLGFEKTRPADWQVELGKYLQDINSISTKPMTIDRVVEASKPWNFSQEMSHTVFGGGNVDLPFPPERIQCVLLKTSPDSNEAPKVVFVALHNDNVWRIDWVVHEGAGDLSSHNVSETMSSIGCNLDLE